MSSADFSFQAVLAELLERRELEPATMQAMLEAFIAGACDEMEMAALLIALRMKGETAGELAAAAQVLRRHMIGVETSQEIVLDVCGTGGDRTGTFNVSTATALLVSAAGVPVVKHGNRAVSSRSGSADVLAELGVHQEIDAACASRCLREVGLAFCLAPRFQPALRQVAGVRRRLSTRTLFNCLGPLVNPARTGYQLLGVGQREWLDLLAGALARLGDTRRAFLVHGEDGLDEVSLSGPTLVREVAGTRIRACRWDPEDFGLEPCSVEQVRVAGPQESAAVIRAILEGDQGPAARLVWANAAAALLLAGRVESLRAGVQLARDVVASGQARAQLARIVALTRPDDTERP